MLHFRWRLGRVKEHGFRAVVTGTFFRQAGWRSWLILGIGVALVCLLIAGPAQAKDGHDRKASSDEHAGSEKSDDDSEQSDSDSEKSDAALEKSDVVSETSDVDLDKSDGDSRDEESSASGEGGGSGPRLDEVSASVGERGVSGLSDEVGSEVDASSPQETEADRATTAEAATAAVGGGEAQLPSQSEVSPPPGLQTTQVASAQDQVRAQVDAGGDRVLSAVEAPSEGLTRAVKSVAGQVEAQGEAAAGPVVSVLQNTGEQLRQLTSDRVVDDAAPLRRSLSATHTGQAPAGMGASRPSHAGVAPIAHEVTSPLGAIRSTGTATAIPSGFAAGAGRQMDMPSGWLGLGPGKPVSVAVVSPALHPALPPPPPVPPVTLPAFTAGLSSTLLFSIFAALMAAVGWAAPRVGRRVLPAPARWRPLLFVSVLERPG